MRLVLDNNVVVSAAGWGGKPAELIARAEAGRVVLATSPALMAELRDVLGRDHLSGRLRRRGTTPDEIIAEYLQVNHVVTPATVEAVVAADPDDDHVLACAKAAGAELIVTGDAHLLGLGTYAGIPVVTVDEALRRT